MSTERRDANGVSPVTERVARGAALLDEKRPDWFMSVNPHVLDMSACDACVLGQLYGDFYAGKDDLGILGGYRLGFNAHPRLLVGAEGEIEQDRDYAALRTEWVSVINDRRARRYLKGESK